MTRRNALIALIEGLHSEIAALKANDAAALEAATAAKLVAIDALARYEGEPASAEVDLPDLRQSDGGKCSPPPAASFRPIGAGLSPGDLRARLSADWHTPC